VGLKLKWDTSAAGLVDDINLVGGNIVAIKHRNLTGTSKEVCVEINAEKTKYMLLSRQQNAGHNQDIKIANSCFENVARFRYLGTTATNQHLIDEEIKMRLNSNNACYHSVQNILSSRVPSRVYKSIILAVALYGCETWSLTLRDGHRLRVFGHRVLRIFGSKGEKLTGGWRGLLNEIGGACSTNAE
jgi:hypothetical protein